MRITLANLYLQIADATKDRSSSFANSMRDKAEKVAANENGKLVVEIGEKDFNTYYVNADNEEKVPWDNLYASGGIFFKGFANPVKITTDKVKKDVKNGDLQLIPSTRYRDYMQQHALRDAFTYNMASGLSMEQWQMITVAAIVFLALIIAGVSL